MASVPKKGINRAGTLSAAINQKNNVVSGNIEDNVRRTRGAVKRKPEGISGNEAKKRTALGNLTNAIGRSTRNITSKIVKKNETKVKGRTSGERDKNIGCLSDDDEDITVGSSSENEVYSTPSETPIDGSLVKPESSLEAESVPPPGVADFDKENWTDPFCVSIYATDIFENMKKREEMFRVKPYLDIQADLTKSMRVILVDWMVEVQESFEMNHESLYTAVKLVDLFLSKVLIKRDALQLVGATAFLISSKFEERCPPAIDDFLYICDDAYTRREVLKMEINMLKAVDFNLAFPLSYSYLRRYSRCAKLSLETLTLARYILESSLMEYDLIFESESLIAAGSLLLALIMKNNSQWSPTLEYYSGFGLDDLRAITTKLWQMLKQPPKDSIKTIRSKYSHPIFFEVALTPVPLVLEL